MLRFIMSRRAIHLVAAVVLVTATFSGARLHPDLHLHDQLHVAIAGPALVGELH